MNTPGEFCGRAVRLGRDIVCRGTGQTVAAARETFVVLVMVGCLSAVVCVLLRAGFGVSDWQMQHGMGVAARKRERQQHYQAPQNPESLYRNQHVNPKTLKGSTLPNRTTWFFREGSGPTGGVIRTERCRRRAMGGSG